MRVLNIPYITLLPYYQVLLYYLTTSTTLLPYYQYFFTTLLPVLQRIASWLSLAKCRIEMQLVEKVPDQLDIFLLLDSALTSPAVWLEEGREGLGDIDNSMIVGFDAQSCSFVIETLS